MTHERLKKRLRRGEVKSHEVVLNSDGTLSVSITGKHNYGWYRALLLSPGDFAIRPRRRGGIAWTALASELPDKIEIRSDKEDEMRTYLWSSKRDLLSETLKHFHFNNVKAVLGPDDIDGGWRTYTVGLPLITEKHLEDAKREMSGAGVTYIDIQFKSDIADRLAAATTSNVQQWVVVLDQEVLGIVQTAVILTGRLQLSAPTRATSRKEQKSWALQVVGRLAAPLPINVAIVQDK